MLEVLAYSMLLMPFAFFFCCCLRCVDCESKARSVLLTFGGTWNDSYSCGSGCDCSGYNGSTYELPIVSYTPYVGVGIGNSTCTYEAPGDCSSHILRVNILRWYNDGVYIQTDIQAGIANGPSSGCASLFASKTITAAEENPFDCDAPRTVDLPTDAGGVFDPRVCHAPAGTALVESP